MKLRTISELVGLCVWQCAVIASPVALFCLSYSMYSTGKMLGNAWGFDAERAVTQLAFVLTFAFVPVGFLHVCLRLVFRRLCPSWLETSRMGLVQLALTCVVACACAESWLLIDEWHFTTTVRASPGVEAFRPRAWPATAFGLRYHPKLGFSATD